MRKRLVMAAVAAIGIAIAPLGARARATAKGTGGDRTRPAAPGKGAADRLIPLDASGLRGTMRKARGSDLFVHLWASWCGPCMEELPDIDRLAKQARGRGATFLSVSLDDPRRAAHVLEVLQRQAPNLTPFLAKLEDAEKFGELFSGEWDGSIPALFVYDRTGHMRASFVGQLENADIRRLLADITVPPSGPAGR